MLNNLEYAHDVI